MTKSKQRQKVSGAVLVMVLIVMVVLIIMLMATLTVVTTASQRIYTKYEENQAYYSARSALDIFTQNMLEDSQYYAYNSSGSIRAFSYTDDTGATQNANMKQGLALQLELYKIKSQGQETAQIAKALYPAMSDADAKAAMEFVENMEPADVFTSGSPEDKNYSIAATATDSITYQVTLPTLTDPKATGTQQSYYGEMVDAIDTDGDGAKDTQVATIKVEVLDRIYHTATSYGNTEKEIREKIIGILQGTDSAKIAQLKEDIKNGDRAKDKFTLKVTSTVKYMDTEATAVLIYDSTERPAVNSSKAITSVNDVSEGSGLFALGGASSLSGNISVDEGSLVYDSLFLKGNLNIIDSGEGMHLFKDTLHTILGNFNVSNTYPSFDESGSVFYVNGTTIFTVNGSFGSSGKLTNIVSNSVRLESNAKQMQYYGNMYCDTFYLEIINL